MLKAEQGTQYIGIEGGLVALGGLVDDETRLAFGACIVHGHIEAAEARHRLIDQLAHRIVVAHVGGDKDGLRAELLQFDFKGFAFGQAAAGNHQVCATAGKGQSGGAADAGQGSGDKDDGLIHAENSCEVLLKGMTGQPIDGSVTLWNDSKARFHWCKCRSWWWF